MTTATVKDQALVRLALALMLGGMAAGLDTTIVNVAIDSLRTYFHASLGEIQWVSTGYLLALTMVVPLTGWCVERYGTRRVWLASLAVFLAGSVLSGLAWSIGALIVFRILQGLGGSMLLPVIRVILAQAAGQDRMGRAMVYVTVPGSLVPVLGPVIGGVLIQALDWRWAFYVNVPLIVLAFALAWRMLPRAAPPATHALRLDAVGLVLLSFGLGSLVYGIADGLSPGALALAIVLLAGYGYHALRGKNPPIIDLRLFKVRSFAASSAMQLLSGASLIGALFLVPLYYQQVRGASVLAAGLMLAPLGLGMALAMFRTGTLIDRTGAERSITLVGMVLAAGGFVPFALVTQDTSLILLGAAAFVTGLGVGAVSMAAVTATYRGLATDQLTAATSASRILKQVGGMFGTVILAAILQSTASFSTTFTWALTLTALTVVPALLLPRGR